MADPRRLPRWPFIIVGLLSVQMIAILIMVHIAGADPAFGVEPDYYEKAVRWDATALARANGERAGWSLQLSLGQILTLHNERELRITLNDQQGRPIEDASVHIEFFSHSRSASRQSVTLTPLTPGVYAARVTAAQPGLWEVRVEVIHAGVNAQVARTVEIPESSLR